MSLPKLLTHSFASRSLLTLGVLASVLAAGDAEAALWRNVSADALGEETAGWTNKVDLADVNGDGLVDILFANGSAYNKPGDKELNGIWLNTGTAEDGTPLFEDATESIIGTEGDFSRVIKGRDVTGDGVVDIIVGNTYETQTRMFIGDGEGAFTEFTAALPQMNASVGDIEVGDIDGDGDLDIVLADWGLDGPESLLDPFTAPGGQMLVWLNQLDETGKFVDVTADVMPDDALVAWSWEMELIDVDGDFDLDIMASCKVCSGSSVFVNDEGRFTHEEAMLPQFTNNYDFEPMFIQLPDEEESSLAVVTINDGEQVAGSNQFDLRERLFVLDGTQGRFRDRTSDLWPDEHNAGRDDNMVVVLDFDSDGDPDFLIGALGGEDDRLHINRLDEDGTFHLDENDGIDAGLSGTPGTLGVALADLNGDGKLDMVQSQGELADPEMVWVGDEIAPDTAPPIVQGMELQDERNTLLARVHDNKSPSRAHDWQRVVVKAHVDGEELFEEPLRWTGEFYWRADDIGVEIPEVAEGQPEITLTYTVCATDAAGNEACSEPLVADTKADDVDRPDTDSTETEGGCRVGGHSPKLASLTLLLLGLLAARRRRRR